jgi:hypothetical protein
MRLLQNQQKNKAGLFACDEWAVYSTPFCLPRHNCTKLPGSRYLQLGNNSANYFDTGAGYHGALVFKMFWEQIIADGQYTSHSWVAKVDPGATFFPGRLRVALSRISRASAHASEGVLLTNCGDGLPGGSLHAPLEVLSVRALEHWGRGHHRCQVTSDMQEDTYMQLCLGSVLGTQQLNVPELLAHKECYTLGNPRDLVVPDWMDCKTDHAAFYPMETVEKQAQCSSAVQAIQATTTPTADTMVSIKRILAKSNNTTVS